MLIAIIFSKEQEQDTTHTLPIVEQRMGSFTNHGSPFMTPVQLEAKSFIVDLNSTSCDSLKIISDIRDVVKFWKLMFHPGQVTDKVRWPRSNSGVAKQKKCHKLPQ